MKRRSQKMKELNIGELTVQSYLEKLGYFSMRIKSKHMRNQLFLIMVILWLSAPVFGQFKIENGTIVGDNEMQHTSEDYFPDKCNWIESEDHKKMYIIFYEEGSDGISEMYSWDIEKIVIENGEKTYEVLDRDGRLQLLTFLVEQQIVLILTVKTNKFSAMSGEGVDFSNLKL